MKVILRLSVLLLSIYLVGCSYFSSQTLIQNRNRDYLRATSVPPLRIPPGVATSQIHHTYPVSDTQYPESAKEVSLIPPGL